MSFNIEQVRKAFPDPALSKIAELTKRIAKLEADNIEIETDDLTGYGDSDHTNVRFTDYFNFIKRYAIYHDYLEFDGVNDYVDLGNHSTLWSQPLGKFSWSAWIYPTAVGDTDRDIIRHGITGGGRFRALIDNGTGDFRWNLRNNADSADHVAIASGLVANNWHHVVGTYDKDLGSANIKAYLDSVLGATTANHTESKNLSVAFTLGGNGFFLKGRMRDFRFWNSKSLTQSEIILVMDNSPLAPTPDYWLPLTAIQSGNPVDIIQGLTASLTSGAFFPDRATPKLPYEPDYDKFCLDLRFETIAQKLYDYSGKQNILKQGSRGAAHIYGEPCPVSSFDVRWRGGTKRNVGWKFSQSDKVYCEIFNEEDDFDENENGEEIERVDLRMLGKTIGFSWLFRFNPASLTQDLADITLIDHYDDGDNSYRIMYDDSGFLKLVVDRAGTIYKLRTSVQTIFPNQTNEIVVTYDIVNSNAIKFYRNGKEITSTTTTTQDTHTFNTSNTYIFAETPRTTLNPDRGFCDMNWVDLARVYKEKVVTAAQVANHWRNHFTISNIPEGDVAILDASVISGQTAVSSASFTDTSFTDTSFTT